MSSVHKSDESKIASFDWRGSRQIYRFLVVHIQYPDLQPRLRQRLLRKRKLYLKLLSAQQFSYSFSPQNHSKLHLMMVDRVSKY